jgi:hypothetical protein
MPLDGDLKAPSYGMINNMRQNTELKRYHQPQNLGRTAVA